MPLQQRLLRTACQLVRRVPAAARDIAPLHVDWRAMYDHMDREVFRTQANATAGLLGPASMVAKTLVSAVRELRRYFAANAVPEIVAEFAPICSPHDTVAFKVRLVAENTPLCGGGRECCCCCLAAIAFCCRPLCFLSICLPIVILLTKYTNTTHTHTIIRTHNQGLLLLSLFLPTRGRASVNGAWRQYVPFVIKISRWYDNSPRWDAECLALLERVAVAEQFRERAEARGGVAATAVRDGAVGGGGAGGAAATTFSEYLESIDYWPRIFTILLRTADLAVAGAGGIERVGVMDISEGSCQQRLRCA